MADTKVSALTAASTLADTDVLPIVNASVSKKVDLNTLTAYFEQRGRRTNASTSQQTWAAAEAYLAGSNVVIPSGRLQVASVYRVRFEITKTSVAGTAAPIVAIKLGTAGTTADTTRVTLTFAAQTAVADTGFVDVYCTFRTVGATATIRGSALLDHQLAATGLANVNTSCPSATSASFDVTTATVIGASCTWGTSFVGTTNLVQAELLNLA